MQVGELIITIIQLKMKILNIFLTAALTMFLFFGCKYDNSYLDATDQKARAYFASSTSYVRTVIPGEGLYFGIGPAMAGVINNRKDQTVDMIIVKQTQNISESPLRVLLPDDYYNSGELGSTIRVTIPKGKLLADFFQVKLDSIKFLNDPLAMTNGNTSNSGNTSGNHYAIPVKIIASSLDSISASLDSVLVAVRYQAPYDGYYLYKNTTITPEHNGVMFNDRKKTESFPSEGDNSCWRLTTRGPFTVRALSPNNSFFEDKVCFDLTVQNGVVTFGQTISDYPEITPEGNNIYDSKTRDFQLNFKFVMPDNNDTTYHVSTQLYFRNRIVDNVNQTRDYLSYFNN